MKLSQLLAHATIGLETMAEECQARGIDRHRLYDEESRILRAIAPAVEGLVQHLHEWHLHNPAGLVTRERCEICRLFDAMKEAGVSCD